MRSISPHLSVLRSVVAIALGCSLVAGSQWPASARTAGAIPAGGLSISSEPADAAVFVDGRSVGVSPVQLPAVAAGEHRVRIVKSGYLENARVVTVVAGEPKNVHVTLTRTADTSDGAGQVVSRPTGSGGGGGPRSGSGLGLPAVRRSPQPWCWRSSNKAPTPGTATVSPTGTGIAGVTNFSFASQGASDPDGNPVTFTWNFGDGGSATGSPVSHVFASAGSFNVSLTVSDGKADAKAPDVPVTVRNVAGNLGEHHSPARSGRGRSRKAARTASGSYTSNGAPGTPGTVSGTLASQRAISGTAMLIGFTPFTFSGTFDSGVATLSVVANGSGFNGETLTFTRQ